MRSLCKKILNRYLISRLLILILSPMNVRVLYCTRSGLLPVNDHADVNILKLNYVDSFIFHSSTTRLSNNIHFNVADVVLLLHLDDSRVLTF